MLSIDTYNIYILAFGYHNEKNQNKDKWNHFNHMPNRSLLGAYHSLPLSDMAKVIFGLKKEKNVLMSY